MYTKIVCPCCRQIVVAGLKCVPSHKKKLALTKKNRPRKIFYTRYTESNKSINVVAKTLSC